MTPFLACAPQVPREAAVPPSHTSRLAAEHPSHIQPRAKTAPVTVRAPTCSAGEHKLPQTGMDLHQRLLQHALIAAVVGTEGHTLPSTQGKELEVKPQRSLQLGADPVFSSQLFHNSCNNLLKEISSSDIKYSWPHPRKETLSSLECNQAAEASTDLPLQE